MRLPADEGLAFEGALKAARERLHSEARTAAKARAKAEGRSTKDLKVPAPTWADAAVGLAHSILNGGAGGAEMAARSRVLIHLEAKQGAEGWMASLHLGGALPDELRRYLTCDGDAQIIWSKDGAPVDLGRTQRIVPRRVRRLIEHRDRGCRVPGCDQTYWLQIHHIIHWEDGGETVTANLICLCSAHHRMHHQGLLGIVGHADEVDGVVFTDRYGRPLGGATRARAPKPRDMPQVAAYTCPTSERLDRSAVHFNRTPTPLRPDAADARQPDDPGPTTTNAPPSRRRTGRCRTTGRPDVGPPDGSRAPPVM